MASASKAQERAQNSLTVYIYKGGRIGIRIRSRNRTYDDPYQRQGVAGHGAFTYKTSRSRRHERSGSSITHAVVGHFDVRFQCCFERQYVDQTGSSEHEWTAGYCLGRKNMMCNQASCSPNFWSRGLIRTCRVSVGVCCSFGFQRTPIPHFC